ncbi:hypothetical protein H7A76_07895 [Pseudomonas sp. MSSRFD41]|uniref:hypothetical protein n=2 Tax=unclassified Pseudomonas TaxID=196821 RepID=UPI00163B4894|nr:hypothetical protein [Pseudomonas sp. MSSRFD41]MBC2655358.1 hypothetical protein [Pseudomonas sp. MSSRFD41]
MRGPARGRNLVNTSLINQADIFGAFATGPTGHNYSAGLDLQLNLLHLTDETCYDASHVGMFAIVAPGRSAELAANVRF